MGLARNSSPAPPRLPLQSLLCESGNHRPVSTRRQGPSGPRRRHAPLTVGCKPRAQADSGAGGSPAHGTDGLGPAAGSRRLSENPVPTPSSPEKANLVPRLISQTGDCGPEREMTCPRCAGHHLGLPSLPRVAPQGLGPVTQCSTRSMRGGTQVSGAEAKGKELGSP